MSVNQLIQSALSNVKNEGVAVPYGFLRYEGPETTYITYYTLTEKPNFFCDDIQESKEVTVSITIFSKENYLEIIEQIKAEMTNQGFLWKEDSNDFYDDETSLYYRAIDFTIERSL